MLASGRCTSPRTLYELSKLHEAQPDRAKALIAGILLWVACDPESRGQDRTLEAVRDYWLARRDRGAVVLGNDKPLDI